MNSGPRTAVARKAPSLLASVADIAENQYRRGFQAICWWIFPGRRARSERLSVWPRRRPT